MAKTIRKRATGKPSRRSTATSVVDFPTRRPSLEEQEDIAAMLKLSPDQAEKLWQAVARMYREFERFRSTRALPGDERTEVLRRLRTLSRHLVSIKDWLHDASPHVRYLLPQLLGPVLAERVSEFGFWDPTGSFPADRFSIHDLRFLECDHNPRTNECEGVDRISANRFLRRVETNQLQRRQNAAGESARVLESLVDALNAQISEYLILARQYAGGRTGQPFRNAAIRQIAQAYHEIAGKQPTGTPNGAFATWCECILAALGMSTEGLEGAIQRQLAVWRG